MMHDAHQLQAMAYMYHVNHGDFNVFRIIYNHLSLQSEKVYHTDILPITKEDDCTLVIGSISEW